MFFNCKRSISCFVVFFSFFKITAQELEEQKGDKLIVGLKKIVAGDQILSMPVFKKKHITLTSQYDDLSELLVKENDLGEKGDVIGKGGVSGNARGSHLHFEVRYQGKSINPEYIFEFNEDTAIRSDEMIVTKKWATPRYHRSTRQSTIVVHKTLEDISLIEEQQQKVYTVKKGDTLHRIANKYGLAISEICKNLCILPPQRIKR